MGDTAGIDQAEQLNVLYKDSFRRSATKDYSKRIESQETFPYNDYTLGQEILLNTIKTFPVGNSLPNGITPKMNLDDKFLIDGTNFGGFVGYFDGTNHVGFTLKTIGSGPGEFNDILDSDPSSQTTAYNSGKVGTSYEYSSRSSANDYYLAQLAPGGFVRDSEDGNIRHFHRLILSPVDLPSFVNNITPIDTTNTNEDLRTYAFAAFDRDGNNILSDSLPSNITGSYNYTQGSLFRTVENYPIYISSYGYSIRQFNNSNISIVTQSTASGTNTGNYVYNFKNGLLLFHDIPVNADSATFFSDFPPVISFFKYIGPKGLSNISNSEIIFSSSQSLVTIVDEDSFTVLANGINTKDIKSADSLSSGAVSSLTCLVEDSSGNGYLGKYTHSKIKNDDIFSIEHEINNSNTFKATFITETGILKVTNLTGTDITNLSITAKKLLLA